MSTPDLSNLLTCLRTIGEQEELLPEHIKLTTRLHEYGVSLTFRSAAPCGTLTTTYCITYEDMLYSKMGASSLIGAPFRSVIASHRIEPS